MRAGIVAVVCSHLLACQVCQERWNIMRRRGGVGGRWKSVGASTSIFFEKFFLKNFEIFSVSIFMLMCNFMFIVVLVIMCFMYILYEEV